MESIFDYIAFTLHNPTAAIDHINDFERALENVCDFPNSCPLIDNEYVTDKAIRKMIVNNYIVFYRVNERQHRVEVVRVLYGMMDYEKLL